jgi:DNA polymerase-2
MTMPNKNWIFDVYPEPEGMVLWVIDEEGQSLRFDVPFSPSFYLEAAPADLRHFLSRIHVYTEIKETIRKELDTDEEVPVVEVTMQNPLVYEYVVKSLQRHFPERDFFTCDIDVESLFFYEKGLFPLAQVELDTNAEGQLLAWHVDDDPWRSKYDLPPISIMELRIEDVSTHPKQCRLQGELNARVDERGYTIAPGHEVHELTRLLERHDPQLILTEWGDDYLIAALSRLPGFHRIPFHRDGAPVKRRGKSRSYFTYGQVKYSAPSYFFRGRWHVDRHNSFVMHESDLQGLFELARLSKKPVQRAARLSTGSIISAMQIGVAIKDGYLVPWRKQTVETPKTAEELLTIDKGGLTYQPRPGLYENVGEIDFASMYPTVMSKFNLSPETMNCACCAPTMDIPEAGYHTCKRRHGLVPKTIEPLLKKRAGYKRMMKETDDPSKREAYDCRQKGIKWLLVTCFGYLGYKNARFGRIEAHEATTALGREKLLQAKEVAEAQGFQFLHGLTDSLWVVKEGANESDYARLSDDISGATGIPAELEGVYRWLAFAPSRENPQAGVPNRFFGIFSNGETKIRGIELRRSDTTPFVRRAQEEMLEVLFRAKDKKTYLDCVPQLLEMLEAELITLREGRVDVQELAVTRRLSRDPIEYKNANATALAAQELFNYGVQLHAGERVKLIFTDTRAKFPGDRAKALALWDGSRGYDAEWYAEELCKAASSLLFPAGLDSEELKERFPPPPGLQRQIEVRKRPAWPNPVGHPRGPLFAHDHQKEANQNIQGKYRDPSNKINENEK